MAKQKRTKNKGSKEGIKKQAEYAQFVVWCATPDALREIKTQQEFGKSIGVDVATLSKWKNTENFWPDVEAQIKVWMKDRTQNVLGKLYAKILKDGNAQEVKLWMQYGLGFSEKLQVEDKSLAKVFNIEKLLKKIANEK